MEQRSSWPKWTRQPWVSKEPGAGQQADSEHAQLAVEEDLAEPVDMGTAVTGAAPAAAPARAMVIRNLEERKPTEWLGMRQAGSQILELNGCKRCGKEVCDFIRELFPAHCGRILASKAAPETRLVHTFYDTPWRSIPSQGQQVRTTTMGASRGDMACCNDTLFARLALTIWWNIKDAQT